MDEVTRVLGQLSGNLPEPRANLSEAEKDALIQRVGPRTVRSLLKAQSELPLARIPFLFSTLDTQAVVDILANDMRAAMARLPPPAAKRSK